MGKDIYYIVVAVVVILGVAMPQQGPKRKNYIILMTALHTFICGWRYKFLTGDLMKYEWGFSNKMSNGWFSDPIFNEGRNFGFFWFEKFINNYISNDFQWVLIIIAVITEITLAILIYKYSPNPGLSYLMWNCAGLYIFGFSAIKQALAMGLLIPACDGLLQNNPKKFLVWTLLSAAIHVPALVFLPAYWIVHNDRKGSWLVFVGAAVLIVTFRTRVVEFVSQFYYDDDAIEEIGLFANVSGVGGRFIMMVFLLMVGYFVKGLSGTVFRRVFKLIAIAAVLQTFSGFDNIFTRLADYYFQFVVLYAPMLFYDFEKHGLDKQIVCLNKTHMVFALIIVMCFSFWFYSSKYLNYTGSLVDDVTNYRFCWEEDEYIANRLGELLYYEI